MDFNQMTIAEIVRNDYRTATVFKQFGIDFCCGGKKSITQASEEKDINPESVIIALQESLNNLIEEHNYDTWELDFLADYIIKTQHAYVRKRIPEIQPFLDKVFTKHGENHQELQQVFQIFQQVKNELASHMEKEELIVFPYIKKMVNAKSSHLSMAPPHFGSIVNPLRVMEMEHEEAGNAFKRIRDLTNDLTPPDDACNSYRVLFSLLSEFESNLHLHIHLENNILFPKSIELENEVLSIPV